MCERVLEDQRGTFKWKGWWRRRNVAQWRSSFSLRVLDWSEIITGEIAEVQWGGNGGNSWKKQIANWSVEGTVAEPPSWYYFLYNCQPIISPSSPAIGLLLLCAQTNMLENTWEQNTSWIQLKGAWLRMCAQRRRTSLAASYGYLAWTAASFETQKKKQKKTQSLRQLAALLASKQRGCTDNKGWTHCVCI